MQCSQCRCEATGKFCSQCGAALPAICQAEIVQADYAWEHEPRLDMLLRVPHVRAAVDRHATRARTKMTGEQFLALCDKLAPQAVSLEGLMSLVHPWLVSWGIGTGKERSLRSPAPVGRMLLRLLCSLAQHGQAIRRVEQASDGCVLEAAIPSDVWSLEGDLLVTVQQIGAQTEVRASTRIKGQLFDWGKSNRCLDRLFGDLASDPVPGGLTQLPRVA